MIIHANNFERALLALDRSRAEEIIRDAASGTSPAEVANTLVTKTLQRIGELWEEGKLALSQVYMSGLICEEIIDKILPPSSAERTNLPVMAIGVFEDFHMLGKRIVYSTLRASGYELIDLGGGLKTNQIIEKVKELNIRILLLSVLMLPSALRIKSLKSGLAGTDVKLVVGGAPFRLDDQLWREVGADAYGKDSGEALAIINKLAGEYQ